LNKESLQASFETALIAGDESTCRKIMSAWYAMYGGIATVADELLSPTFRSIGEKWVNGKVEIYQERRACDVCYRLLHELRRLLPEPQGFAPLAMGGSASGDGTQLPSQVIEIVFREYGWRTSGLGSNLPFSTMLSAARQHMPKIFWLSSMCIENTEVFLVEYARFAKSLPKGIMLLVGGRALNDEIRQKMVFSSHCDTMLQLSNLAKTLRVGSLPTDPQI
jgi:methanogenic corrinoid protein MtbC1